MFDYLVLLIIEPGNDLEQMKTEAKQSLKNIVNSQNLHLPNDPWKFPEIEPRTLYNIWQTLSFLVIFIFGLFFQTASIGRAWQAFKEGT